MQSIYHNGGGVMAEVRSSKSPLALGGPPEHMSIKEVVQLVLSHPTDLTATLTSLPRPC